MWRELFLGSITTFMMKNAGFPRACDSMKSAPLILQGIAVPECLILNFFCMHEVYTIQYSQYIITTHSTCTQQRWHIHGYRGSRLCIGERCEYRPGKALTGCRKFYRLTAAIFYGKIVLWQYRKGCFLFLARFFGHLELTLVY